MTDDMNSPQKGEEKEGKEGKFPLRHRARELATQILHSLDVHPGQDLELAMEYFLGEGGHAEEEHPEVKEYCRFLTRGAWEKRPEVDNLLLRLVTNWRPERMVAVDRAVMRLMIFEGFLSRKLPPRSAIAEAIELARTFGTEESPRFVNGVLARVMKHIFPDAVRLRPMFNTPQEKLQKGQGGS